MSTPHQTRILPGGFALPVVVVVALTILVVGCGTADLADRPLTAGTAMPVGTAAPTPASTSTTVRAGWQVVSHHGVQIQVPAAWPVRDGNHTIFCGGPFPPDPAVFVGPQHNGSPSCPAPPGGRPAAARDGAWLQAGDPLPNARLITTSAGASVQEAAGDLGPEKVYWFQGVTIIISNGADPSVAAAILDSVASRAEATDTPAVDECPLGRDPAAMPAPERLETTLELEHGNITLAPPHPADAPTMTAAEAWAAATPTPPNATLEHTRLILARYSSKYPAKPGPGGVYLPLHQDTLAWVIYAAPLADTTTSAVGTACGEWSITAFDALTRAGIGSAEWSPGP